MNPRSARTQAFLGGPIGPQLLRLSVPNILVMLAQAATGLVETWWISRLGVDALAGMALVFPVVMLMQMMSQGAMGGGASSAIARALGAGRRDLADALVLHVLLLFAGIGLLCSVLVLAGGPWLYRMLGGDGAALDAALAYSDVVFAGMVVMWLMNGLASIVRGTGNMLVPAVVICGGVVVLVPLSPLLIFGAGPLPALGVAGGGVALLLYYAGGAALLAWYVLSGRNGVRLRRVPLSGRLFGEVLRVGAVASLTSLQTNLTVAVTTALVGSVLGAAEVAGYGTGARLEYLLGPLVFGIGGTLVAMVGTNIGAGQHERAMRITWIGGAAAFLITEMIGIAAAIWPHAWLRLFDTSPGMLEAGSTYLRIVGPFFGFYGLGFAVYFASQGAGRLGWPLLAGFLRMVIATGGGWLMLRLTGSLAGLFAALAAGLVVYGVLIPLAVWRGAWRPRALQPGAAVAPRGSGTSAS